jgi:Domain of unknown function (DUF4177)
MAEWQYRIHRVEVAAGSDLDNQLASALAEYGKEGWELVEILQPHENSGGYRLIFKSEKPMD